MLPAQLKDSAPFSHGNDCTIWKADKGFQPEWHQDPADTNLWIRECQCSRDYYRTPPQDSRPPMPGESLHRHGVISNPGEGIRDCTAYAAVEVRWLDGHWQSHCRNCVTWTHYGTGSNFPPPRPFDQDAINKSLQLPDRRAIERKHILDALGIDEETWAALVETAQRLLPVGRQG